MLSNLFIILGCCNLYLTQGEGCAQETILSLAVISLISYIEMLDHFSCQPGIIERGGGKATRRKMYLSEKM